jgi:hypothetical protein
MISLMNLTPYTDTVVVPSPNHESRRAAAVEGIVLHATADEGHEEGTITWLCSPKSRVSCHLVVSRTGRTTRLVGDHQRAWHAGVAWWRGTTDVNSITLGIEIANRNDGEPYTDAQYIRVAKIVAHYCRQGLSLDDVVSHGAITEDRRTDPLGWDWERFSALVEQELQPVDVFEQCWNAYDRRNSERLAVDEADPPETARSVVPMPPQLPAFASITLQAKDADNGATVPRRSPAMALPAHAGSAVIAAKPAHYSRTIWLNAMTMIAAGMLLFGEAMDFAVHYGVTMPIQIPMWALVAIGALNIVLRFQTRCPIGKCSCDQPSDAPPSARVAERADAKPR